MQFKQFYWHVFCLFNCAATTDNARWDKAFICDRVFLIRLGWTRFQHSLEERNGDSHNYTS